MLKIRYGTFETNSSSMHTLVRVNNPLQKDLLEFFEQPHNSQISEDCKSIKINRDMHYGRQSRVLLKTPLEKATYLIAYYLETKGKRGRSCEEYKKILAEVQKTHPDFKGWKPRKHRDWDGNMECFWGQIDHQSMAIFAQRSLDEVIKTINDDSIWYVLSDDNCETLFFLAKLGAFNEACQVFDGPYDDVLIRPRLAEAGLLGFYKNGNAMVGIYDDGTKIMQTKNDSGVLDLDFATNIDIKITNQCKNGCRFCYENSCPEGKHGDLNHPLFDTLKPYQEVALGGGNPLAHPELLSFLYRLKEKKVIANITLHQNDFEENFDLIKQLVAEDLLHGVGVSLVKPTKELVCKLQQIPGAVVHVILGVTSEEDIEKLAGFNLKILFLGYKATGRGQTYNSLIDDSYLEHIRKVHRDKDSYIALGFKSVSYDTLALKQLKYRGYFSDPCYMGDDGTQTFYIDLVKEEYSTNSIDAERKPIKPGQSVQQMFQDVKVKSKRNRWDYWD